MGIKTQSLEIQWLLSVFNITLVTLEGVTGEIFSTVGFLLKTLGVKCAKI